MGITKKNRLQTRKVKTVDCLEAALPFNAGNKCFFFFLDCFLASLPHHFKPLFDSQYSEGLPLTSCVYQKEFHSTDLFRDGWYRLSLFFLYFYRHACYMKEGRL